LAVSIIIPTFASMFKWKPQSEKFKGEGIYHLTFAVNNRVPLLGELRGDGVAYVSPTPLGIFVINAIEQLPTYYPKIQVITKCLMPDHVHILLWTHEGEYESIKMVARAFAQGCSKEARRLWQLRMQGVSLNAQLNCVDKNTGNGAPMQDYSCGNGANTLFSTPYVRTLVHAGQLRNMYDYIRKNPQLAWIKRMHPDLFRLRRNTVCAGLTSRPLATIGCWNGP